MCFCTCCCSYLSSTMHTSHTGFYKVSGVGSHCRPRGVCKSSQGNAAGLVFGSRRGDALQRVPGNSSLHTQWKSGTLFLRITATDDGFRSFEVLFQQGSVCEGGATRRSHCMNVVLMIIWQLSALCIGKINVTVPIWLMVSLYKLTVMFLELLKHVDPNIWVFSVETCLLFAVLYWWINRQLF